MGIDLFTFVAQIINLIILLFLLRHFLYVPVLKAVEARQKSIAAELAEAQETKRAATVMEKKCAAKMQEIEQQKAQLLAKVREEALILSNQLNEEAKAEYEQNKKQWQKNLQSEQQNFEINVQSLLVKNFELFTRQAMQQLADVSLETLMLKQFANKMDNLEEIEKKAYIQAFSDKTNIKISTAQSLTETNKKQMISMLQEQLQLSSAVHFSFVKDKKLICGVAVYADEQCIEWSMENYLQNFKENLHKEILKSFSRGEA